MHGCNYTQPEYPPDCSLALRLPLCPKNGLKVQQMDEIMGRSVITIISLHPQGGSAGASGGGQVIDGLGSALSVVILFTMPNDGSQRKMWLFSLTNV